MVDRPVFTWDPRKAATNLRKHGVDFTDAVFVFEDPGATYERDRIVNGEERWRVVGWSGVIALLVVAYVTWDEESGVEVYRLISARPATRAERRAYEEGS